VIPIRIQFQETRPPETTVRAWREIRRTAIAEAAHHWHREMLPGHFAPNARARYRYQSRTGRYMQRKRQLAQRGIVREGGSSDLVFSGLLRDTVTRFATIRHFPTRATLQMTGPRYITMRPRASGRPHLAAEVTTVLKGESDQLARIVEKSLQEQLARLREQKRTTF
jgi:hypothetical protein